MSIFQKINNIDNNNNYDSRSGTELLQALIISSSPEDISSIISGVLSHLGLTYPTISHSDSDELDVIVRTNGRASGVWSCNTWLTVLGPNKNFLLLKICL